MTTAVRTQRGRLAIAVAAAAAVLALGPAGLRGGVASAGGTAQASRTATVTIVNFSFKPATVTIPRGSKVRFSNTSGTTHTATRKDFNTGRIKPGTSAAVTFNRKGTFPYHCSIHSFMKGKVVVD